MAAAMVGALGMAGSLISYEAVDEGPVAARNLTGRVLGMRETRDRVEALLGHQKERVAGVLAEHRDVLEALRDALLARDELVGEEILEVIRGALRERERRGGAPAARRALTPLPVPAPVRTRARRSGNGSNGDSNGHGPAEPTIVLGSDGRSLPRA
jgi:hypothetical protein